MLLETMGGLTRTRGGLAGVLPFWLLMLPTSTTVHVESHPLLPSHPKNKQTNKQTVILSFWICWCNVSVDQNVFLFQWQKKSLKIALLITSYLIWLHDIVNRCPQLFAPAHGSLKPCSNVPGQTCQFSCDKGYLLSGTSVRTCKNDGAWTGIQTQCTGEICCWFTSS